jgi:hypothetical protein
MKTRNMTMKLIALIALAIAVPQTSYTQGTRPKDVNVVNTPNVNVVNTPTVDLVANSIVGINPSSNIVQVASSSREPVLTTQTLSVEFLFQKQLEIDLQRVSSKALPSLQSRPASSSSSITSGDLLAWASLVIFLRPIS